MTFKDDLHAVMNSLADEFDRELDKNPSVIQGLNTDNIELLSQLHDKLIVIVNENAKKCDDSIFVKQILYGLPSLKQKFLRVIKERDSWMCSVDKFFYVVRNTMDQKDTYNSDQIHHGDSIESIINDIYIPFLDNELKRDQPWSDLFKSHTFTCNLGLVHHLQTNEIMIFNRILKKKGYEMNYSNFFMLDEMGFTLFHGGKAVKDTVIYQNILNSIIKK